MTRALRGVAIVGWANVLVAAVIGSLALLTTTSVAMRAGGWELIRVLVAFAWAVVQLAAGLGLVDRRGWARRYLMYGAVVHLSLIAQSFAAAGMPAIREMVAYPTTILEALRLLLLTAYAVPVVTLLYLGRPAVRAAFPQTTRTEWLLVDAPVVALALLAVMCWFDRRLPGQAPASSPASQWARPIEPGVGPATLVPLYDGKPIRDFTATDVRFTLTAVKETPFISPTKKVQTGTGVETIGTIERPWRLRHGRIRIKAVPAGVYHARIEIDRNGNEATDVGDLVASGARVELRTGHGPVREPVRLQYVMALREPRTQVYARANPDNNLPRAVPGGSPAVPTHQEFESLPQVPPHVTFAWDPVPGAVSYHLTVACDEASEPSQMLQKKLDQPSWTTDLTRCPVPYPWLVYLSATGGDGYPIGGMRPRAFVIDGTPPSRTTRGLRPAALTLRPTFDGRPLRDIDDADVSIELRAPFAGFERSLPRARVRHGRIKIPRFVPNEYLLTMKIGPDARERPDCRPLAGDYVVTGYSQLRDVHTDWQPESRTLAVQRTLQLVEPEEPVSCGYAFMHVQSPLHLRWEPIPEAVEYTVQVTRPKDGPAKAEKIVVREPSWEGRLARSNAPNDNYFVKIAGRTAKGQDVALLQHHFVVD